MKENKPNEMQSAAGPKKSFKATAGQLSLKVKDFWTDNYDEVISGIIVFLLVALAFGLGVFYGGRFYEDSQININCPASFWEEGG